MGGVPSNVAQQAPQGPCCDPLSYQEGLRVGGGVRLAVAVERKRAAVEVLASCGHNVADAVGVSRIMGSLKHHLSHGELSSEGLVAGLKVDRRG